MIGIIEGTLVAAKVKSPDKDKGQDFKPYQVLSIMQVHDGDADIIKIKDLELKRQHKSNAPVKLRCRINHWSNSNMSGQAVTILDVL
jgi:hypothetical protein